MASQLSDQELQEKLAAARAELEFIADDVATLMLLRRDSERVIEGLEDEICRRRAYQEWQRDIAATFVQG